jgi:ribosomal protein S18 acetylase RimI-like enzyme
MPLRWEVRVLDVGDVHAYKSLRDHTLEADPSAFSSDAAAERLRPAHSHLGRLDPAQADQGQFTLGVWDGSRLVGALSCEREARVKLRHRAQLVGMMVADGYRGQGLDSALLRACLDRAGAAQGLEMLTLSVTDGNAAALRLYERFGFERYGTLPRALRAHGRDHAEHLMVLTLPARPGLARPTPAGA